MYYRLLQDGGKMKGMSMVVGLLISLVMAVVVIGLLTTFFLNQGGGAMDTAKAQRVFNTQCPNVDPMLCSSFATSYKSLLESCKVLFPEDPNNIVGICMTKCDCYICDTNGDGKIDANDGLCNEVKQAGINTKEKARSMVAYEHVPWN